MGHDGRAPVPTEAAGHLANVLEGLRVGVRAFRGQGADAVRLVVGRREPHFEWSGATRDVEAVDAVHIARGAEALVGEEDLGGGVEPLEDQIGAFVLAVVVQLGHV